MSIGSVGGLTTALQSTELPGDLTTERSTRLPASGSSRANSENQPTSEELNRISADMQRKADAATTELQFVVDQSTGRTLIRVTDRATHQLIRQIPTEEAVEIAKQINNFQQHMLFDQKV